MRKLKIQFLYCNDSKSKDNSCLNCGIKNTSFSQVASEEFFALRIYDWKTLNILVFLNKVLKLLSKDGFVSIYYLIDLKNQEYEIKDIAFDFRENLISINPLGNKQYSVIYEFNNFEMLERFFEQELNNFINMSNGIWINEKPTLSFLQEDNRKPYQPLRHSVSFQNNYVEIGEDADYIQVLFKNKSFAQRFLTDLGKLFDVNIECIEVECNSEDSNS